MRKRVKQMPQRRQAILSSLRWQIGFIAAILALEPL